MIFSTAGLRTVDFGTERMWSVSSGTGDRDGVLRAERKERWKTIPLRPSAKAW